MAQNTSAVKYSGLSPSRLYELLAKGRIESICLKGHQSAVRGVRLVDRESIDLFMQSLQEISRLSATETREVFTPEGLACDLINCGRNDARNGIRDAVQGPQRRPARGS